MPSINTLLVSHTNEIKVYDIDTFQEIEENVIRIDLELSDTREENEILSMVSSADDMQLVVITGKQLFMDEEEPTQLFVYDMVQGHDENSLHDDKFVESHRITISSIPGLENFSMRFSFKADKKNVLIFSTQHKIFEFNFVT